MLYWKLYGQFAVMEATFLFAEIVTLSSVKSINFNENFIHFQMKVTSMEKTTV